MLKLLNALVCCLIVTGCIASSSDTGTPRPENAKRFVKLRGFTFDKDGLFNAAAERDVAAINAFALGHFDLNVRGQMTGRC